MGENECFRVCLDGYNEDVAVSIEYGKIRDDTSIMRVWVDGHRSIKGKEMNKSSSPFPLLYVGVSSISGLLMVAPLRPRPIAFRIELKTPIKIRQSRTDWTLSQPSTHPPLHPEIVQAVLSLPRLSSVPPSSPSPLSPAFFPLFIQILQILPLIIKALYSGQNLSSAASVKCPGPARSIKINQMQSSCEASASKNQVVLPTRRPSTYSDGFRKVDLLTNHYQVRLQAFTKIVIYRFKITPPIALDNRPQRQKLMNDIKPQLEAMIKNPVISGFNIFSHQQAKATKEKDFTSDIYKINVKQVKVYDLSENPKFLLHFLNNGLRNIMEKMKYMEIGKTGKYFNCNNKKEIDSLFMYDGYKANFVKLNAGYFLRVDSVKKVVRSETVLDAIDAIYKINQSRDRDERRIAVKNELIGKIVMANYGVARYYKITDVHFKRADEEMIDGRITIAQYYLDRYHTKIKKLEQPLIEVESKKSVKDKGPCLLIPELCLMTGIPDSFDEMRRKKISENAIKNPPEKIDQIQKLIEAMKATDEVKALKDLGLQLTPKMHKFQAKTISTPVLRLGGKNSVESGKQAFFNLFNKPIFSSKHDIECAIIFFKGTDVKPLLGVFKSTSQNLDVKFRSQEFEVQGRNFKDLQNKAISMGGDINICLIILPGNMKNDYKKLKANTMSQGEMITQVMTDITMRKKNLQSIATKVLLQIIAKRGNILWVPQTKSKLSNTMLLGFDSAKCSEGTLLGACATINSTFNSLYTTHKIYSENQQKYRAMSDLTAQCINGYFNRNGQPPEEVVIFFNSCAGDQVSLYHQLYFRHLQSHLSEGYKDRKVNIIAVMVNTKTNERFFTDSSRNPQAGTLVSQGLVSENYDFYIISQQSNKGSTVPNHYKVIYNTSKIEEPQLEELIFSQCFNYVNWTGSIKVPAILQYAKKCAKFLSQVLESGMEVPSSIRNKPYFV